jgi:hypothetical protein
VKVANHWSHGSVGFHCGARDAVLADRIPGPVNVRRKELVTRLQAGRCELCKQADGTVDVHHVRNLADLDRPGRPTAKATQ